MNHINEKIKGCLFGQAVGDALGLGTEFMTHEEVVATYPEGLTDYSQIVQDYHRCRWHRGDWTDDTDMMLCIARAIISSGGKADTKSIAHNFKEWFNGEPMGIGSNTYKVLSFGDYETAPFRCAEIVWEMSRKRSAANGGLMRTSVVGLLHDYCQEDAENVCRLTHADPRCVGSCVILCNLIHAHTYDLAIPTADNLCETARHYDSRIEEFVKKAHDGNLQDVCLDDHAMGYTLHTLFAALWAYWHAETFGEGLLAIVNAGGDADTNAAAACGLLGAKFGFGGIPSKYVEGLYRRKTLENVCGSLIDVFS